MAAFVRSGVWVVKRWEGVSKESVRERLPSDCERIQQSGDWLFTGVLYGVVGVFVEWCLCAPVWSSKSVRPRKAADFDTEHVMDPDVKKQAE